MDYFISYCENYTRVIPACIIDSRESIPAIKNQVGSVIKEYIDSQVALITPTVLPYRVETANGVLVGFFAVQVSGDAGEVIMQVLRPAFQASETEINGEVATFMNTSLWKRDFLF